MIKNIIRTWTTETNGLTDGQITCTYAEIPEIFDRFHRYFAQQGIGIENYLALECDNSVPSGLVLLYLLSSGYSFLLLPKEANFSQVPSTKSFIPPLCSYRIATESTTGKDAVNLKHPEQFLRLVNNEDCSSDRHYSNHASHELYLRTSGSTGSPKMAVHSHKKLMENALNCVQRLKLQHDDRIAIPVPITHMYGLGAAFLPGVAVGASIDLQPSANLLRYLQREKEFNPNVTFLTPTFCETLIKGRKSSRFYKLTVAAGDRLKEDTFTLYESRFGCLVKLYGSTEMGAMAAASPDDPASLRIKTVGKPMPGVQMRVDEEIEGIGEIWCQHQWGFERYIDENGNSNSQGVQTQTDWFRTKDLGRWIDGHIEVLGRCDHSVNRDGFLVFFSDVEKAMETIIGIDSVVVVSKGESQRGKAIVAYCVLTPDTNIASSDIKAACFHILPKRAIADRIFIVKSLPMLPNGKIDRQKLINMEDQINES